MNDFSLHTLIQSVEDVGPDAHDMAEKAWPLIPESERDTVGTMLLARYIAVMKPRMSNIGPAPAPSGPARSAKVAAYREHALFLRLRVNVARGADKFMADCTYEDLIYAAENRRKVATETLAAAAEFEALAALLKRRKVATVGDLKPAEVEQFISSRRRETEAA